MSYKNSALLNVHRYKKAKWSHSGDSEKRSIGSNVSYKPSSASEISTGNSSSKEENIRGSSEIKLLKYANEQAQFENTLNKCNKRSNSHIYKLLNSKNRGCNVKVAVQGIGIISGEVVLNFDKIVALKHENIIVFINSDFIAAFY